MKHTSDMSVRSGFNFGAAGYSQFKRNMTKEEEALLIRIFHEADEGGKGYLSMSDMKVAMVELLGYKPTKFEVNQLLQSYRDISDQVKGMPLEGFVPCMREKLVSRDEDEEIRHTFMAFDVQCRGFLTLEDVKKIFTRKYPHIPTHSIHSAFREIDQDGDGRVSYKDFEFLMKYNLDDHI